jgi:hypothetical protein
VGRSRGGFPSSLAKRVVSRCRCHDSPPMLARVSLMASTRTPGLFLVLFRPRIT